MGIMKKMLIVLDLGTMKEKLENFKYLAKEDFLADLHLVFENGKKYYQSISNKRNSKYAQELEKFIEPLLEKLEGPSQTEIDELKAIAGEAK